MNPETPFFQPAQPPEPEPGISGQVLVNLQDLGDLFKATYDIIGHKRPRTRAKWARHWEAFVRSTVALNPGLEGKI